MNLLHHIDKPHHAVIGDILFMSRPALVLHAIYNICQQFSHLFVVVYDIGISANASKLFEYCAVSDRIMFYTKFT